MLEFLLGLTAGALSAMWFAKSRTRAPQLRHIDRGWEVFTVDNIRVGHVDEVRSNEIVVWHAGPAGEDYTIPASAIRTASMGHVSLKLSNSELPGAVESKLHRIP